MPWSGRRLSHRIRSGGRVIEPPAHTRSDNLRPYRATRGVVIQGYPGEPAGQDGLEGRVVDAATRCRREGANRRVACATGESPYLLGHAGATASMDAGAGCVYGAAFTEDKVWEEGGADSL